MATTTQVLGKVGLVDKGVYDANTEYNRLDFVTDENNISTYISKVDNNQGHSLEDPKYWRFLAKGTADAATIRDLLKTVDGAGSGIDADTLDGTQLEEIVNPEALAAASPFDYFLGAKEVDGKWVFKKMSPSDVATVVAELTGLNRAYKVRDYEVEGGTLLETEIESGCVFVRDSRASDLPSAEDRYGLLEIASSLFFQDFRLVVQTFYSMSSTGLSYKRVGGITESTGNLEWFSGWKTF